MSVSTKIDDLIALVSDSSSNQKHSSVNTQYKHDYASNICQVLYTENEIKKKINELALKISNDYKGKDLLLVGLFLGCNHFLSDLSRAITIPHTIGIIGITSYQGTESTNNINLYHELNNNCNNKHILIIEDLLDTGFTMNFLINNYFKREKFKNMKSLKICCLINKKTERRNKKFFGIKLDYCGFILNKNYFIVGYGMDYNQHYRSLPFIGVLKESVYKH